MQRPEIISQRLAGGEPTPIAIQEVPLPAYIPIAHEIFVSHPSIIRAARKWVPQEANRNVNRPQRRDIPVTPRGLVTKKKFDIQTWTSEGLTNALLYGGKETDSLGIPVSIGVVTEPGHEGNILVVIGDYNPTVGLKSGDPTRGKGTNIMTELSLRTGYAFDVEMRSPNEEHPLFVAKAFWGEWGK